MPSLVADPRRDLGIRRYPIGVYVLVGLAALVLQSWLPRVLGQFAYFDLPLLVTIYFSLSRRNPVHGTILGALLGIFQDGLTHLPIGIHGIADTVVGFLAASVGIRIEVGNRTVRLILNLLLTLLASGLYFVVVRLMLDIALDWDWMAEILKALGNAAIGLAVFPLLDLTEIKE